MNDDEELKGVLKQLKENQTMKCRKCNKEISELDEKCSHFGFNFEEYEKQNSIEYEEGSKTIFLKVINYIQLVIFIIIGIINSVTGQIAIWIIYIGTGLVTFAFIKGFSYIIDLLSSIDGKLK